MSPWFNDPKHWRERAAEARGLADGIDDPQGKQAMLNIAADYEKLARRAEQRRVLDEGLQVDAPAGAPPQFVPRESPRS